MISNSVVKFTLGLSCPFNFVAAGLLAFPSSSLGRMAGLPESVPVFYAALPALLVAMFGVMYGWMAMQDETPRELVFLGAAGKASVFFLAFILFLADECPGEMLLLASGDLAFATLWFAWLRSSPGGAQAA
jgi:hypothetical protein